MGDEGIGPGDVAGPEAARTRALTEEKRDRFLATLTETGNVQLAAQAAGATLTGFYVLRDREQAFAEAWATALERGLETLDGLLLAAARGDPVPAGFDPALALTILNQRSVRAARGTAESGWNVRTKRVPIAQVEAEVLRRLAALKRQRARKRPPTGA